MLEHFKENWRQLKDGEPGRRFRDVCDGHWRQAPAGLVARLFAAGLGMLLIVAGVFLMPAPGPGWATVILGLALLATAWRPAARLLDWAEPRARSVWERMRRKWHHLSRPRQAAFVAAALLLAAALCVVGYIVARELAGL